MKLDTATIVARALCYTTVGFTAAYVSGVTQYGADETISWRGYSVIIALSVGGAAGQLLAFLSGSFKDYMEGRKTQNTEIKT